MSQNNLKVHQHVALMMDNLSFLLSGGFAGATGTLGQIDSSDEVRFKV